LSVSTLPFVLTVAFAGIVIVGMTLFLLTVTYHLVVLRCPFVPTSRAAARAMVAAARLSGTERVYDLGAGDGAVLIQAKRRHPGITAIGIEKVITVWWLGKLRIRLSRQTIDLRLGDAFETSVADADAIFLYVVPHLMERLERKFNAELRPGTVVISNSFRFPQREPQETFPVEGAAPVYRYEW
jgi:trans-aconitate methyltransferase